MVAALLLTAGGAGPTGWPYTTDRFRGVEWLEALHAALATLLLWPIALHVAGVVFTSWRHREKLVAAMIDGRKDTRPDDIDP